jgi:Fic-DOC domain mobile mystery protein B
MGLNLDYDNDQTPLDEDEKEGLLIPAIATRSELNEFEQRNIERAMQWALSRSFKKEEVFTETFIKKLHRHMYGDVWKWAGEFRISNKNLGVDKFQIGTELKKLLGDVSYWFENGTFSPDELAVRFKHRLVSIHCFANGNGRHSRLMADLIIEKIFRRPVFSWGSANLVHAGDPRTRYINAIKQADKGDYTALIEFARS